MKSTSNSTLHQPARSSEEPGAVISRAGNCEWLSGNWRTYLDGNFAKLLMTPLIFGLLLVTLSQPAFARRMRGWTYQEMLDQSDLVVIARPVITKNTPERTLLPNITPDVHVLGVETGFEVSAVLKGSKETKKFTLHHYNLVKPDETIVDGPSLFFFAPKEKQRPSFLLFLVRESDGRYVPVTGQTDPTLFSILELRGIPE